MKTHHHYMAVFAIIIGAGLFFYNNYHELASYPGSKRILKKYYPENEILGMAHDEKWYEVRISNDPIEPINRWYDEEFSRYRQVENSTNALCTKKSWQDGDVVKLRLTICHRDDYRTILAVYN